MKAVRLIKPAQALELREIPRPVPGRSEVLIRVMAAGICHSDAHYRAGRSPVSPLPLTLGHEVAGIVEEVGPEANGFAPGDRVCLHYLATCGDCSHCKAGTEQFCPEAAMIGKHRDGGYAEFITMPARSLLPLPSEISFEHGAVLMCSAATALHALKKARLQAGESVSVFGIGGLGASAIQLARALGAAEVFAVDIKPAKLELARQFGAVPINATRSEPASKLRRLTAGRGVDVALELIGLPLTMSQAVRSLAPQGRAAIAGITPESLELNPYHELINREAEIIGVSDHLFSELPLLLDLVRRGRLDLTRIVTRAVPLEAGAINDALDRLENFSDEVRMVIVP